jgi:uncharacterized protein
VVKSRVTSAVEWSEFNAQGLQSLGVALNNWNMSDHQTILITGATGLIGSRLAQALESAGHVVLRAVRREASSASEVRWVPERAEIDAARLEGLDGVVHLAGANIAGQRWSDSYKQEIRESRVKGTRLIAETLANLTSKPRVFVCASAIGYYGDRGDEELTEDSPPGVGFLPDVCVAWEAACQAARDAGVRTVNARIGVVLSQEGGALKSMLLPFKLGVGGVVGSGRQYFSWMALDDIVSALKFVLDNDSLTGPVNLVSPRAVTNREFTKTLGTVLGRPTILPLPAFAARIALGEMADELLLASNRVLPTKLQGAGFHYAYPELESALRHELRQS